LIDWLKDNPAHFAAVCTIIGGILLKVTEQWLGRSAQDRADRADYRSEIASLNDRIDKLETSLLTMRANYYASQEENALLRMTLITNGLVPPKGVG